MMKLEFRQGTPADTEALICFLTDIKKGMKQQNWFYLDPPDVTREMMANGSMQLWLALEGERIAAICSILYPALEECNYGHALGMAEEDLLQVVQIDTVAVYPDYRGMGLQRLLVCTAENALGGHGEKILLSTVHPDNQYSLNNMLKLGYKIQRRINLYGSERFVLRKNIF